MKTPPKHDILWQMKFAAANPNNAAGGAARAYIAKQQRDAQKNAWRNRAPETNRVFDTEFEVVQTNNATLER